MEKYDIRKLFVVTGATSGIGLAISEGLLEKGHHLIGVGRSPQRCAEQLSRLEEEYPHQLIAYLVADFSLQPEIHKLARAIQDLVAKWGFDGLDGLVNNAGTFTYWQTLTPEGFDTQWAVNHLAPFLLTNLLLPLLEASDDSRVISVSSGSHYGARLNWNDIQGLGRYNPLKAYKQTKLANVLFTVELNRRLGSDTNVWAAAADPGLVNTGIGEKSNSQIAKQIWSYRRKKGIPAQKSAEGIISLLLETDLKERHQIYWKAGKPKKPNPYSLNQDHSWRLWEISARMTGIQ